MEDKNGNGIYDEDDEYIFDIIVTMREWKEKTNYICIQI